MPFADIYRRQVALLIRLLPLIAEEKCFALKGGTAINLFIRDMPRLSVDIDLTYVPVQPRAESLAAIDVAFGRIIDRIEKSIAGAQITETRTEGARTRLLVRAEGVQIKIEVTPVLRGCVYQPELRSVTEAVEDDFGFAEMPVASFADLYAGKLVAALDRQHPRDFFDVRDLLANEGIDDALRRAFIVYLISHDRPMHEVLQPRRKDISEEFVRGFNGMTEDPVTVEELAADSPLEAATRVRRSSHFDSLMWTSLSTTSMRVARAPNGWRCEDERANGAAWAYIRDHGVFSREVVTIQHASHDGVRDGEYYKTRYKTTENGTKISNDINL
jgi:predicted nucleotidyltransferase component of viral defense system